MNIVRLGKFTGRIYKNDEIKSMKECGVCITEEEANNSETIQRLVTRNKIDCFICGGHCPEANSKMCE